MGRPRGKLISTLGVVLGGCVLAPACGYGLILLSGIAAPVVARYADMILAAFLIATFSLLLPLSYLPSALRFAAAGLVLSRNLFAVGTCVFGGVAAILGVRASVLAMDQSPEVHGLVGICLQLVPRTAVCAVAWILTRELSLRAVARWYHRNPLAELAAIERSR